MKRPMLSMAAALLLATPLCGPARAQDSFQEQLKTLRRGEAQAAVIQQFADAAASGNADRVLSLIWPTTRTQFGEEGWKTYATNKLQPFFAGYRRIDSYEHIETLTLEQGNHPALVHFGYIRDASDHRKPFEIVVVTEGDKTFVANVLVGTCRKGLHPICE
jgi:hypothetical protein